MQENQIVYISPDKYQKVINLSAKTKAAQAAVEVTKRMPLEYGFSATPECGQYGRVLEVVPLGGKSKKNLVAISTFTHTLDENLGQQPVRLVVLDSDAVTVTDIDSDMLLALSGTNRDLYIRKRTYTQILDSVFPDRYDFSGSTLTLHFPEITITNTNNNQHIIRDLYVQLKFTTNLKRFTAMPVGRRLSLVPAEVTAQYRHSHLPRSTNSWGTFCLGHTTMADKATDFISSDINPDHFLVFLYQLQDYVSWESLEGGPHIRLAESVLAVNKKANSSDPSTRSSYVPSDSSAESSRLFKCASRVIARLVPDDIEYKLLLTGEIKWFVRTSPNLFSLINNNWSGNRFSFNVDQQEYVAPTPSGRTNYDNEKRAFLTSAPITFRGTARHPIILGEGESSVVVPPPHLEDYVAPMTLRLVVYAINNLLNHPREIYFLATP